MALLAGVVASLLTRPVKEEQLENFYGLVRTPVAPDECEVPTPCTLPEGVTAGPRRKLLPWRQFEIYVPSARMVTGFVLAWMGVGLLIAIFVWIVHR
jgi:hypothetical protein